MMFPQRNTLEQMCIYKTCMFPLRGNTMIKLGLTDGKNEIITPHKKKKKYHHLKLSSLERRETLAAPDCLKMQIRHNSAAEIGPAGLSHWQRLAADNHRATAANASKRQPAPPLSEVTSESRGGDARSRRGRQPRPPVPPLLASRGCSSVSTHHTHTHTQSSVHRFPSGEPQGRGRSPHMTSQFTGV